MLPLSCCWGAELGSSRCKFSCLLPSGFKSMKGMRHTFLRRVLLFWVRRDLTEGTVNEKRGIENEAEEQRQVEAEGCRMRTEKQCFIMHRHPSLSHQMRQKRSEECMDAACECQPPDVCQRQQRRAVARYGPTEIPQCSQG